MTFNVKGSMPPNSSAGAAPARLNSGKGGRRLGATKMGRDNPAPNEGVPRGRGPSPMGRSVPGSKTGR